MGKYHLPAMFVLLLGLSAGAYAFIVFELDGSKITTKHSLTQPEIRRR